MGRYPSWVAARERDVVRASALDTEIRKNREIETLQTKLAEAEARIKELEAALAVAQVQYIKVPEEGR